MTNKTIKPFQINIADLKSRGKSAKPKDMNLIDSIGEKHGFIERPSKRKRGRLPSPRTGQVHAKVLPSISVEIANESKRRGVQQGVLIEESWSFYKKYYMSTNS